MSVVIPLTRVARRAIRPRLFSGNQEGVLGGIDLPVPRPGDRFAVDVATTQLQHDAEARLLIAALTEATTGDARIDLPAYDLARPSAVGSGVVVDGGGQLGSAISLRGSRRSATILRGQYLTLVHGGRGYLYMARAHVVADAAGKLVLPIWPMLRAATLDGSRVAVDDAFIEGRLVGFDKGAAFIRARVEPLQFSIEERR